MLVFGAICKKPLIAGWLNPGGPHPTTAASATPLHFVRNLQCDAALAAKSGNRSRLTRDFAAKRLHWESVPMSVCDRAKKSLRYALSGRSSEIDW
jgi:hypothetical protein